LALSCVYIVFEYFKKEKHFFVDPIFILDQDEIVACANEIILIYSNTQSHVQTTKQKYIQKKFLENVDLIKFDEFMIKLEEMKLFF
jgi:hypothetical protein